MVGGSLCAKAGCQGVGPRLLAYVLFASVSGFLLGYDLCFMSSVLVAVQRAFHLCYPCPEGTSDAALADCECPAKQFAVSSVAIGAIVGGVTFGWISDALGRRRALMLIDALFAVGAIAMSLAPPEGVAFFYAGRMASGAALGGAGSTTSAYIAELAPPAVRGRLIQINELAVCAGCLVAYIVAATLGDERWRYTVGIPGVLAVVQLLGVAFLLPESPRWLAMQSDAKLEGGSGEARYRCVDSLRRRYVELRKHWRPLLLAIGCALAQNSTNANTALYYSRTVLQRAGLEHALQANMAVGAIKFLGVGSALVLVDRVGRRRLLIWGTSGCILSYAGLVAAFAADPAAPIPGLALASMLTFIFSWDISWAGLMLMVAGELLPQPVRGMGLGIVFSTFWAVSFVEEQTFLTLFRVLSVAGTFALFGCTSLFALSFATFILPETKGLSLEAIAEEIEPDDGSTKPGAQETPKTLGESLESNDDLSVLEDDQLKSESADACA